MSNLPEAVAESLPTIDPALAEKLVAEASAQTSAPQPVPAPETPPAPERTILPEEPLERFLGDEPPTVRKAVLDAAWLHGYPELNRELTVPSEDDKVRYALSLTLDDSVFVDVQRMLGGRLPVVVESITGEQQELLYQFLTDSKLDNQNDRYFSELQYAGAALQVREVGTRKFDRPTDQDALRARIADFKKMQNQRWALVLLAVRHSLVKNRLLAEMIVNYDAVFTVPGASGS